MTDSKLAWLIAVTLGGIADATRPEFTVIEDRDPGDEQPEPDYMAMIGAAIDRDLLAKVLSRTSGSE